MYNSNTIPQIIMLLPTADLLIRQRRACQCVGHSGSWFMCLLCGLNISLCPSVETHGDSGCDIGPQTAKLLVRHCVAFELFLLLSLHDNTSTTVYFLALLRSLICVHFMHVTCLLFPPDLTEHLQVAALMQQDKSWLLYRRCSVDLILSILTWSTKFGLRTWEVEEQLVEICEARLTSLQAKPLPVRPCFLLHLIVCHC